MTSYKLIKKTVSEDAIQHLSDKHDEERDDNPELARELDALCGKLNGEEQIEKEGETFLVVCATAVKETIEALSDIHDDMQDDNPDGAEEIDGVCGELQDGLDVPLLLPQEYSELLKEAETAIHQLCSLRLSTLPKNGSTSQKTLHDEYNTAFLTFRSIAHSLPIADLKALCDALATLTITAEEADEANQAINQLSSRNLGAPQ